MKQFCFMVTLVTIILHAGSEKKEEKQGKDSNESSNKEEVPVRPCIDYKAEMDLDATRDDSRDLEQKSKCMPWCTDWVTHDWWEKCAWDRCKGCTQCEERHESGDYCRPMALVKPEECQQFFKPLKWAPKVVNETVATEKYHEFCVNATQDEPYKINFLGPHLGDCEGATCECRLNPICANWRVSHDYSHGNVKSYLMQGYSKGTGRGCCDGGSCTQYFYRTELQAAEPGDHFCWNWKASPMGWGETYVSWFDIAGGLFMENKLAIEESDKYMGVPIDDKLMFFRGWTASHGKSIYVEIPAKFFLGVWLGGYDTLGEGLTGAWITLSDFAHGTAPDRCENVEWDGSYCWGTAGDLEEIDIERGPNCCGDLYIFQKNTCKKGPDLPPCNLQAVSVELKDKIQNLGKKYEKVTKSLKTLRKTIREYELSGDVHAPDASDIVDLDDTAKGSSTNEPQKVFDTNLGEEVLLANVTDPKTGVQKEMIITIPPPMPNITRTLDMNMATLQHDEFCGVLASSLGGHVEDCDLVKESSKRAVGTADKYRRVRVVIEFGDQEQADEAEHIVDEKIESSLNLVKETNPNFNIVMGNLDLLKQSRRNETNSVSDKPGDKKPTGEETDDKSENPVIDDDNPEAKATEDGNTENNDIKDETTDNNENKGDETPEDEVTDKDDSKGDETPEDIDAVEDNSSGAKDPEDVDGIKDDLEDINDELETEELLLDGEDIDAVEEDDKDSGSDAEDPENIEMIDPVEVSPEDIDAVEEDGEDSGSDAEDPENIEMIDPVGVTPEDIESKEDANTDSSKSKGEDVTEFLDSSDEDTEWENDKENLQDVDVLST